MNALSELCLTRWTELFFVRTFSRIAQNLFDPNISESGLFGLAYSTFPESDFQFHSE